MGRRRFTVPALLLILAASQGVVGVWAMVTPRGFYDGFPAPGHPWVAWLGPYNEHLVFDYGAASLALVVVTLAAAARPSRDHLTGVALAWIAWAWPHLLFHAAHLDAFPAADAAANSAIAFATAVIPVYVLFAVARRPRTGSDDAERKPRRAVRG